MTTDNEPRDARRCVFCGAIFIGFIALRDHIAHHAVPPTESGQ